ncbi:cysteine desulfurase, SufS subfamily [Haloterrigena turkmenica DSM 5511]|uniref:cysteine desulfurase n=1 Tax=Haloterrigena turkmenica (strain ATCC 51198 / DSM 5511 / JCM 9101 / NCIMB 13204 / VKM B-1734 / 4k) TaxID=543526 RepID=D2RU56_HALTV|nr:cysteine desulfurase [Haloterrigena turkmenica]ADB59125.1 cysteine desulfurase, SufS subfamily [Haloterrigena turkmenica DSM 5511]
MSQQNLESLDVGAIRDEFPILEREFDGQQVVYLDNAATTQTPDPVVDAMSDYYRESNANIHRGIHHLSQEASIMYEEAHDRVAEFINADGREEVIFTKNTTEGENLIAYAWGLNELGPGDEIVLTEMEHHASLVTWQQIGKRTGADVKYIRIDEDQRLDMDHARELITDDTAIVSAVHVSNTLGTVNPVSELTDLAHEHDALSFIDGAQAVPNRPVDVKAIDADFYAFSGHKMAGPTGIGVLYGKQHLLEEMEPYLYGGGMIRKVTYEDSTWGDLPWKFEPGTPQIAEAVGLEAAIDWLEDIGMERIQAHEEEIARYAYERLESEEDVEIYGPEPGPDRGGLVSFNVEGVHAHDLASIMNDHTIAVRAGDHCTQPLHDKLGVPASTRASFYVYNTREEVDKLVAALDDARQLFA